MTSLSVQKMQKCFESRDVSLLQQAVLDLPKEEAEYHIKRCIESGLWIPNAGDAEKEETEEAGGATGGSNEAEGDDLDDKYEQVD